MGVADSCPRRGSVASATLSRMDDGLDSQLEGGTERSLRTLGVSEWEAGSQTGNPATQVGLCRALGIQVCWRCWVGCTKLVPSEDRAATAAIEWTVAGGGSSMLPA